MRRTNTVNEVRELVRSWKRAGHTVGLVPTMGYLHAGHESLMRIAGENADKVVVSVFVNPLQFGPSEDFERYPRDAAHDLEACERNGVELVFFPEVGDMYPEGFQTAVEVGELSQGLCGASRPGHFRGVCTVVCKLFHIVEPDVACFGRKDAQQLAVIRRMARDLDMPVRVIGCPIIREEDGLARSSRNAYLKADERAAALCLSRSLRLAQQAAEQGERDSAALLALIRSELAKEPLVKTEYAEIVDADNLRPLRRLEGDVLIALAARVGATRLIDNTLITIRGDRAVSGGT